jgi:hypothetical protein
MILTNEALNNFRNFLISSWSAYMACNSHLSNTEIEDRDGDWLQANWEILVEASITEPGEYLWFYGDGGADCNGMSSRVWLPAAIPTHRVVCKIKKNVICKDVLNGKEVNADEIKNMEFLQFTALTKNGKWYENALPFDYILLSPPIVVDNILISIDDIYFDIERL